VNSEISTRGKKKTKETGHVKSCSRTNIICSNAIGNDWSILVIVECETQKERKREKS
jgi:hypothetical protein